MNYLCMVEYDGLIGWVEFNSKGQRINYILCILEKFWQGYCEIGVWYFNCILVMNVIILDINLLQILVNKMLVVIIILENLYVMWWFNFQVLLGNECFEGFCVDMLWELVELLCFCYCLWLVEDGLYGVFEFNGFWIGMVGEFINWKVDLVVVVFIIIVEWEKVIDFFKFFMILGISIFY